jgi:hypothetical protein
MYFMLGVAEGIQRAHARYPTTDDSDALLPHFAVYDRLV